MTGSGPSSRLPGSSDRPTCRVGLIADPGPPALTAAWLVPRLSGELARRVDAGVQWEVDLVVDRLVADEQGLVRAAVIARAYTETERFDVTVCLTDHPRRARLTPIVAEADVALRVGLAVLPALGIVRMRSRSLEVVVALVAELTNHACDDGPGTGVPPRLGPFRRVQADDEDAAVRFAGRGPHSRLRLLAGMIRANRPWRLAPSLSGSFAAALGTGGLVAVNSTVWNVAASLGALRLAAAAVLAVATMSAWLVVDHGMWERDEPPRRELSHLYNAATVGTVAIGVLCLYAGLLVLGLVVQLLLLRAGVLAQAIGHSPSAWDRFEITWLVASVATVGGALGQGFETDEAVHVAAYGFRQRQRRQLAVEGDSGPGHDAGAPGTTAA